MKKHLLRAATALAALVGMSGTAHAQWAVIDVNAIAQHIQTVRNTLDQLNEARRMYQTLNSLSQVRNIADLTQNPIVQSALPQGLNSSVQLLSSDLQQLGAIGQAAQGIINNRNLSLQSLNSSLGDAQGALEAIARNGAASQAYGENLLRSTETTNDDLLRLTTGLQSSTSLRDSQDVAASAAIANTAVNNRILQLMAQIQARGAQAGLDMAEKAAANQRAQAANTASHVRPTYTPASQ
jgi:type IV secretion system protein VirB5